MNSHLQNYDALRKTALQGQLVAHLREAEDKAWEALARYKFQMFGYWAAIWVHLNRVGQFNHPNPFASVVREARKHPTPEYYCPKHRYNPAPNSGFSFCPTCEVES
jgi:hypothetical protein